MNTALVVVDVQVDAMDSTLNAAAVIEKIANLVSRARELSIPVIWVQHSDEWMPEGSPQWQIVPELQPLPVEPRVLKTYSDSFANTTLERVLADLGIRHIYLCGAQTDACIRSTLFGGLYRGYGVTLVSDAHTTLSRTGAPYAAEHAIALVNAMASYTILPRVRSSVVTSAEAFTTI